MLQIKNVSKTFHPGTVNEKKADAKKSADTKQKPKADVKKQKDEKSGKGAKDKTTTKKK